MNETLYRVVDDQLYQVKSDGNHIHKGVITGSERVIMEDDGDNLVIVSDRVYVFTESTDTFQENTNVNLVNVLSVTIINNQFIYTTEELSLWLNRGFLLMFLGWMR